MCRLQISELMAEFATRFYHLARRRDLSSRRPVTPPRPVPRPPFHEAEAAAILISTFPCLVDRARPAPDPQNCFFTSGQSRQQEVLLAC